MGSACSTYGGQGKCIQRFGWENLKEGDHLKYLNVDENKIKWIFKKYVGRVMTGFIWLGIGIGGGLL
jgi:hypothetical protein